jgi:hypothetical protein
MRKVVFPDVQFGINTDDGYRPMSVAAQLHIIASAPSKPGDVFTIDQIRARLPLVEKLSALKDATEVLLEESEYTELLQAVQQSTWNGVSPAAVALADAIAEAEIVEVDEKK